MRWEGFFYLPRRKGAGLNNLLHDSFTSFQVLRFVCFVVLTRGPLLSFGVRFGAYLKTLFMDGFIFPSARDSSMPITYFAVKYAMIKACERSGVRYRSVHIHSGIPLLRIATIEDAMLRFCQNFSDTQMWQLPTTSTSTYTEMRSKKCERSLNGMHKKERSTLSEAS